LCWLIEDGIAFSYWTNLAGLNGSHVKADWEAYRSGVPAVAQGGANGKEYRFLASTGDHVFASMRERGHPDSILAIRFDIDQNDWRDAPTIGEISEWQ